jgi:hypothetical protein
LPITAINEKKEYQANGGFHIPNIASYLRFLLNVYLKLSTSRQEKNRQAAAKDYAAERNNPFPPLCGIAFGCLELLVLFCQEKRT